MSLVLISAGNQAQPMTSFCCSVRATHPLPLDICNHQTVFHDSYGCKSRSWSFTPLSLAGKPKDDDSYTHPFFSACLSVRKNSQDLSVLSETVISNFQFCYGSASSLSMLKFYVRLTKSWKKSCPTPFTCPEDDMTPHPATWKPLLPTVL